MPALSFPLKFKDLADAVRTTLTPQPIAAEPVNTTIKQNYYRSESILLAEDNPINQQVVLGILESMGFLDIEITNNGQEVIHSLQKRPFDVVLMDISMPVMDGFEATRTIRKTQFVHNPKNIPIVALTAHALKGDREKCLQAGMDEYLAKPISASDLANVLSALLQDPLLTVHREPTEKKIPEIISEVAPPFDYEVLLQRLMGDSQLVETVLRIFIADSPIHLTNLQNLLKDSNLKEIERIAHKLKGAAASVEAKRVEQVAFRLEQQCRSDERQAVPLTINKLNDEILSATRQMQTRI